MDTIRSEVDVAVSVPEAACLLGSSPKRVANSDPDRASRRLTALGIPGAPGARGKMLSRDDLEALRGDLGGAPIVDGVSRAQLRVLAALSRRPLGVRSARALARAASISPTVASRLLNDMVQEGLVTVRSTTLAEGKAMVADVYTLNRKHAQWRFLAETVRQVQLPVPPPAAPAKIVPVRLRHHFWNARLSALRVPENASYVAGRLVLSHDPEAVSWALAHLDATSIEKVAESRGLSGGERRWVRVVARAATP
jgi:hypothetical protein